jgi:hypothetical protein
MRITVAVDKVLTGSSEASELKLGLLESIQQKSTRRLATLGAPIPVLPALRADRQPERAPGANGHDPHPGRRPPAARAFPARFRTH